MKQHKIRLGIAFAVVLGIATPSFAQQAIQWRVEDGGNGHWYQVVPRENRTWSELHTEATGTGGHLATVANSAENSFIINVGYPNLCFLGGFRTGGVCGAPWQWVDGSPFVFTSWEPGQPQCTGEDAIAIYTHLSAWHDFPQVPQCCVGAAMFEWSADCNKDGVVDHGQILDGTFPDVNTNGIPDTCECLADLDDSGAVNSVDLAIILAAWGTAGGKYPQADINENGLVDATDLSIVLAGWGPCPD